jgi:hypothetical protein
LYRVREDRDSNPAKRQRKAPFNFKEEIAYHQEPTCLNEHNCLNKSALAILKIASPFEAPSPLFQEKPFDWPATAVLC